MTDRQAAIEIQPDQLQSRLRWARDLGHPHYLWPNVAPAVWRAALREIERVTRSTLHGERAAIAAEDADSTRALGVAAFTSGMGPLLGAWIERGSLDASDRIRALFALHLEHGRRRAERLTLALQDAARVLNDGGVAVTVLKGAHTAHTHFDEPGLRPMSDIDLLVAPEHRRRAESALARAGYALVPGSRLARPYRSDWRPPGSPMTVRSFEVHHRDDPYTIDLHDALELNFFGVRRVRFDVRSRAACVPARWAGPHATALPQPLLAAYHAAHASQGLHNLTLIRLVELVLLLRPAEGIPFDWAALLATVRHARAERFVWPAFAQADRLARGTVDSAFLDAISRAVPPNLRRAVEGLTPATAQRLDGVALDEQFMWAATPTERMRRAAYMLVPGDGSFRRFRRIYRERVYRLIRRRVTIRD